MLLSYALVLHGLVISRSLTVTLTASTLPWNSSRSEQSYFFPFVTDKMSSSTQNHCSILSSATEGTSTPRVRMLLSLEVGTPAMIALVPLCVMVQSLSQTSSSYLVLPSVAAGTIPGRNGQGKTTNSLLKNLDLISSTGFSALTTATPKSLRTLATVCHTFVHTKA